MLKKRILLLEDEIIQQRIMGHLLTHDYELSVVSNGSEALQWLETNKLPDLIIMDWIMPVMDGKSFLEKFKESIYFLAIPIIVLSSYELVKQEIDAIPFSAHDRLGKPVPPEVLKNSITSILSSHKTF